MSEKKEENPMDRINRLEQIVIQQQQQIKALNDELVAIGKAQKELIDILKAKQNQSQSQTQQSSQPTIPTITPEDIQKISKQFNVDPMTALAIIDRLFGGSSGGSMKETLKLAELFFETWNKGVRDTLRIFALLGSDKRKKVFEELFKEEEEEK